MSTMKKEEKTIGARITLPMYKLIQEYLRTDAHLNESDLIRDALRFFFEQKRPDLYDKYLRGKTK